MRIRVGCLTAIGASMLLCLGIPAFGQTDVTIDFTGVENTNVQALGAYGGYYSGTVNDVASEPGFICDDYNNEIFLPTESWQATAISFASLGANPSLLADTDFASIGLAGYAAIADLAAMMNGANAQTQAAISAAIWYIGALGSGSPLPLSDLASVPGAEALVNEMESLYGSFNASSDAGDPAAVAELEASSLWLYTPTGEDIVPSGDPTPQEFIGSVAVPEGGAALMFLLLAGGSCFGAMFFRYRNQLGRGATA